MCVIGQGQAAGNLRQRSQIELVGLQGVVLRFCCDRAGMRQGDVATGPLQALLRAELQALGADIKAVCALLTRQAANNRLKRQWLQLDA